MSKTIWEMLKSKTKGAVELQITNPLKLKIGSRICINVIDFRNQFFHVKRILEYKRIINGHEHVFTDYDLLSGDIKIRLRLNPVENPDAGLTHNVVLLKLYEEMGYDESFYNVLTDTTKVFEVLEDGVCTERYYRINDVQSSYKPTVTIIKEGNAKLEELEKINLEYWDYWREIKDEAGQPFNQFLFIEMDKSNGYFEMWRGEEVIPEAITVF